MSKFLGFLNSGVISGEELHKVFYIAKKKKFALAAINCIDTNSINSVLEAAKKFKTIVIIQFSFSGANFFIGKNFSSFYDSKKSVIFGSILGAKYVHEASKYYDIPVILHTDHCFKENLYWIDAILDYNVKFYNLYKKTLFTSHMIDLSNYNIEENLNICKYYLKKMSNFNINLELELGCTGGEEDGLDNSKVSHEKLYTNPEDVLYAYNELKKINNYFTIAASFGNTHGVYKPGNVNLSPEILYFSQKLVRKKNLSNEKKPLSFVFHGGSGSSYKIIKRSIDYGIVKINLDTDIQWSSWKGIFKYYIDHKDYLQSQLGNPNGLYKPNKKFYDPRVWLRSSQESVVDYLGLIFKKFNCYNLLNE